MNSFNYSALASAQKCEQLFKYQYIDRVKQPGPDSGDMKFGTALHLGLEGVLTGGDGVADFNLFWDLEKSKPNKYGRYGWVDLKDQGERLLERFKRLHAKKFEVFEIEQRLYGALPSSYRVEGTPDFIGTYNGVRSIVDFKTSGSRYHKDRLYNAEQLYLYAHLAKTVRAYQVEQIVYYVFVKGNEPSIQTLVMPIDEALMEQHLDNISLQIERLIKAQGEAQYTKNRASCIMGSDLTCPFFNTCYIKNKEEAHEKV